MRTSDACTDLLAALTGLPAQTLSAVLACGLWFFVLLETRAGRPGGRETRGSRETRRGRDAVLDEALRRSWPGGRAVIGELPGAAAAFGTEEGLLLALQQRWSTRLAARLLFSGRLRCRGPALPPGPWGRAVLAATASR